MNPDTYRRLLAYAGLTLAAAVFAAALAWGTAYVLAAYPATAEAQRATAELAAALPEPLLYLGLLALMLAGSASLIRLTWSVAYVTETWLDLKKIELAARPVPAGVPAVGPGPQSVGRLDRPATPGRAGPAPRWRPVTLHRSPGLAHARPERDAGPG